MKFHTGTRKVSRFSVSYIDSEETCVLRVKNFTNCKIILKTSWRVK